ncbi:MAG TPA: hypothetical protein VNZ58_10720 [Thermomicrobiales bacterium]|nr:hypothetical protein [Thermomicrobiales bacterium]
MVQETVGLLVLVVVVWLAVTVIRLNTRVKELGYRLDLMTQQVDIPENPVDDELRELIRNGEDIEAIKRVRERMGLSLLKAKRYVDGLKRQIAS